MICRPHRFTPSPTSVNSSCRVICVSYSDSLASFFSREFRRLIEHPVYRKMFPKVRIARNTEGEIATTKGGFRFVTSVGGTLTGRGADFLIIDDPQNADDGQCRTNTTFLKSFASAWIYPRFLRWLAHASRAIAQTTF